MKSAIFFRAILTLTTIFGGFSIAFAEDYVEPGRFGAEAVVTATTVQGGLVYVNNWLDFAADVYGGSYRTTNSSSGVVPAAGQNDYGGELRLGKRTNLGTYNYLTYGVEFTTLFGRQGSVSLNGTYSTGPYVGLARHFSGTNLMLTVFIFPYIHSSVKSNDGNDHRQITTSDTFLTNGGFGLAYLF